MATVLREGGVVAIPTDTLYGLAADPFHTAAVRRIFAVKRRPSDLPVPLIAADARQVGEMLGPLAPRARRLADRFWPGPLTLLIPALPRLAAEVTAGLPTVGVRVPAHAAACALAAACGFPLTATSANISGAPPTADPETIATELGDVLDGLLDAGLTPGGPPSTIVDTTTDVPALVRAGAVSWEEIQACLRD